MALSKKYVENIIVSLLASNKSMLLPLGLSDRFDIVSEALKLADDPVTEVQLNNIISLAIVFAQPPYATNYNKTEVAMFNGLLRKLPPEAEHMRMFLDALHFDVKIDPRSSSKFIVSRIKQDPLLDSKIKADIASRGATKSLRFEACYQLMQEMGVTAQKNVVGTFMITIPPGLNWDDKKQSARFREIYQSLTSGVLNPNQSQTPLPLSDPVKAVINPKIQETDMKALEVATHQYYEKVRGLVKSMAAIQPLLLASMNPVDQDFIDFISGYDPIKEAVTRFSDQLMHIFNAGPAGVGPLNEPPVIQFMQAIKVLSLEQDRWKYLFNLMAGLGPYGTENLYKQVYEHFERNINALEELSVAYLHYNSNKTPRPTPSVQQPAQDQQATQAQQAPAPLVKQNMLHRTQGTTHLNINTSTQGVDPNNNNKTRKNP